MERKRARVVTLPTEDGNNNPEGFIVKCIKEMPRVGEDPILKGTITLCQNRSIGVLEYHKPQYLYFTSDEEIKVDDWYLYFMDSIPDLMQCQDQEEADRCNDKTRNIGRISFKIISSTDPKLITDGVSQPTQALIELKITSLEKK